MPKQAHDLHQLYRDTPQSARHAGLRYSTDSGPGITRQRQGSGFRFFNPDGSPLTDPKELARVQQLVIPPAWTDVWICPNPRGHLQATGRDAKNRKQYRYHAGWSAARNLHKFDRMREFAQALPTLRKQLQADLKRRSYDRRKVTATVLAIMDTAHLRVGNRTYAKANSSYGITTLRDRHVKVTGPNIKLQFTGKKGVPQEIDIIDRRLAAIVQRCKDIPGYDLFQYYDEQGKRQTISSDDVNEYLRQVTGQDFTAKDLRTWAGTVLMMKCLQECTGPDAGINPDKQVKEALKQVSKKLGNTPAVCAKYYIHPEVVNLFRDKKLSRIVSRGNKAAPAAFTSMNSCEIAVVAMLARLEKESGKPVPKRKKA